MLKALFKKQFMELNQFYFVDRKTGMRRSSGKTAAYIALFAVLFIAIAMIMAVLASSVGESLIPLGFDWLYYVIMGIVAVLLGVFGSVFNTYASLYRAKDNELLLSMPVPVSQVLLVRLVGVLAMSLLYTAIVWVPTVLVSVSIGVGLGVGVSVGSVAIPILLIFVLTLLVSVITCALGWVVAALASKIKSKAIVSVLCTIIFLAAYYFIYFWAINSLDELAGNAAWIGQGVQSWAWPVYVFGLAASGEVLPFLAGTIVIMALAALTWFILSKTFLRVALAKTQASVKSDFKADSVKAGSVKGALLRKEFKRFVSSSTYMLNCGLGVVIMLALAVIALVKADFIMANAAGIFTEIPILATMAPVLLTCLLMACLGMNAITAPSISLEGKSLWILRSLPVSSRQILEAKENLHVLINSIPGVVAALVLGYVFEQEIQVTILMAASCWLFTWVGARTGLALNLISPNLTWTNEIIPIKQGMPVFVCLFGSWAVAVLVAALFFLLSDYLSATMFLVVLCVAEAAVANLLNHWIGTKGVKLFDVL